ncbi:MAG: hypothetical protein CVT83_08835 [Alphaproteobacteria bacterium HGW-Alphaproteobacteria-5]|nr:MAG: hypothetical protein CVT83_08835 [Alphaproteobacteria bacterium HGW-Alphaproteobacteria-5]
MSSLPRPPFRVSPPSPPIRVSLPPPPINRSLPPRPFIVLARPLPTIRLSRVLPKPLTAPPIRSRFSRLFPSVSETVLRTRSLPAPNASMMVSPPSVI